VVIRQAGNVSLLPNTEGGTIKDGVYLKPFYG